MSRDAAYPFLIALNLILAGTALLGSLFIVPYLPPAWLERSPFETYFLPALALHLVGLIALIGVVELTCERSLGIFASLGAGLGIVVYAVVQFGLVPFGHWQRGLSSTDAHTLGAQGGFQSLLPLELTCVALGLVTMFLSLNLLRREISYTA